MADISSINGQQTTLNSQSLYFAAAQSAQQQASLQAKKSEKTKKTSFASAFQKSQETAQLLSEGLPAEIAGMETEEAVNFLKDAMDTAGDELKNFQSLENMEKYRKKVSQFMRYMVKTNYNFINTKAERKLRNGRVIKPLYQVEVIDQKLNQLTSDMLYMHSKNLNLLARLEEINGMIIDLLAA
ncbi:MAG: YaaR family protein [Treponema sp.]|nr:YaaR family protein [Candidatus Treponema equifaecale]